MQIYISNIFFSHIILTKMILKYTFMLVINIIYIYLIIEQKKKKIYNNLKLIKAIYI